MHELLPRIVAYATPMKVQCGITQSGRGNSWQPDVDGHGLHVQAVLSYSRRAAPQKFVAPRRSIAADNVNFLIRPARGSNQIMKQIENPRIVGMDFSRPVITQKVFQLLERHWIIGLPVAIDDIKALVRVRVI